MARATDDTTADRLKELAQAEMAAAKERLAARTAAARDFAAVSARLAEAAADWERIQGEAAVAHGRAVITLIESGLKPADVATLLGVDAKEVRAHKARAAGASNVRSSPDSSSDTSSVEHDAA